MGGEMKKERSGYFAAPCEVVPVTAIEGLTFGSKRHGYTQELERLLDSPKGSALKIARPSARYQVRRAEKKMGHNVEFAEKDGVLYVRIVPDKEPVAKTAGATTGVSTATAREPMTAKIRMLLGESPMTMRRMMGGLSGEMAVALKARAEEMVTEGGLECEDGVYRLKAKGGR